MGGADEDGWRRLITVEDRFELRSVGLALLPEPELGAFEGGPGEGELRRPDGSRLRVKLDLVYAFPVPTPAVRRWTVLLRGLSAADAPVGIELWVPSCRFPGRRSAG